MNNRRRRKKTEYSGDISKKSQKENKKKRISRKKKKAEKSKAIKQYSQNYDIDIKKARKEFRKKSIKDIEVYNNSFDDFWNRTYKMPNDERWYFSYRDYSGEIDINDMIKQLEKSSVRVLLEWLTMYVNMPPTYRRRTSSVSGSGSGGAAGDYELMVGNQKELNAKSKETYNHNRRSKRHKKWVSNAEKGTDSGYQHIKNGRYNSFSKFTPKKLLAISTAIMLGITEMARLTFYRDFYDRLEKYFPEIAKEFPTPRYRN